MRSTGRCGSAGALAALALAPVVLGAAGCAAGADGAAGSSVPIPSGLTSPAFSEGGEIPVRHTCDGEDVSPELAWEPMDLEAAGIAVLVTDPDAGGFVHWVLGPLPMSTTSLPEDAGADPELPQGGNDFGGTGWGGPCPPSGTTHHYEFQVVSLAGVPAGPLTARAVQDATVVQGVTLTGTYTRP